MDDLLTIGEVARILHCHEMTVHRWIRQGALEAEMVRIPRRRPSYRIKRETLNKVLGGTALNGK